MNNTQATKGIPPRRPSGQAGYLNFEAGDFVLHCCPDGTYNLHESLRQVAHIRKLKANQVDSVFYISTPFSNRQLAKALRQHYPSAPKDPVFNALIVPSGDLYQFKHSIMSAIEGKKHAVLIINSWEFSSRGSRQRDELLYFLNVLRINYDVTIIIYSHTVGLGAHPGRYHKGGLGKLAYLATKIYSIGKESEEVASDETQQNAQAPHERQAPASGKEAPSRISSSAEENVDSERGGEGVVRVVRALLNSSNTNELEGHVLKRTAEPAEVC